MTIIEVPGIQNGMKPGRHVWSPALVRPEWRSIARDLILVIPYWDAGGSPHAWLRNKGWLPLTPVSSPVWTVTPRGAGMQYEASGSYHSLANSNLPADFPGKSATVRPMSMFTYFQNREMGLRFQRAIGLNWQYNLLQSNSGTLRFSLNSESAYVVGNEPPGGWVVGKMYAICSTYDGAVGRIYIDGAQRGSNTVASNTGSTQALMVSINNGGQEWGGDPVVIYLWDRALTAGEVLAVSRDPFGMIRPASIISLGSTPSIAPLSMYYFRQRSG